MPDFVLDPFSGSTQFLGRYRKPGYEYKSAKSVVVPASATKPAYLVIGGSLIIQESDLECNLLGSGLGTGLTLAANGILYLYAGLSGSTVVLKADINDPGTGPRDLRFWTYLGAFPTNSSSNVAEFTKCADILNSESLTAVAVANASPGAAKILQVPTTAKAVYIRSSWTAVTTIGNDFQVGPSAATVNIRNQATSATASQTAFGFFWCPILTAQTVYAHVTTVTTDSCNINVFGWIEEVSEYQ